MGNSEIRMHKPRRQVRAFIPHSPFRIPHLHDSPFPIPHSPFPIARLYCSPILDPGFDPPGDSMQPYDFAMLLVLIAATVFGFWKGMAWQLASLGSLVASYFVAMRFSEKLAPYLSSDAQWNIYLAMLLLYLGTSLVIWIAFRFVSQTIDRIKLREFDRQIGGLLGAAKGVLWCMIITYFAVMLSANARDKILKSRSANYIAQLIHRAKPVLPEQAQQLLGPYLDKLDEELDPSNPNPTPAAGAEPVRSLFH